ncbi:LysM peptidoglycan-binding domain-containing protein [bacterium]|nr:LysM peptidoglycan-binding domain-containing protein [bacterium]
MNTPTLSKKLRSENRKLHGSFYVVMMAIVATVVVSVLFLSVKGMFGSKKIEATPIPVETEQEIKDSSVENKTTNEKTYKVESGDTLYAIGIKLGVDWKEMAKINDLESPYSLSTGQELKIPEGDNKEE